MSLCEIILNFSPALSAFYFESGFAEKYFAILVSTPGSEKKSMPH